MSWLISNALMTVYENSLCSQGREGESLEGISLDGEQCAPSRSSHTLLAYCAPDRTTAFSRPSLSGTTFAPLTESLGAELLTWFLAGFPVRILAQPEMELELRANGADCGWKWQGSLAKYDHHIRLWKTRQHSLFEGLETYLEIWPRWGMMRDGECSPLPMLEHDMSVKGSGSLLTVTKFDSHNRGGSPPNNTLTFWAKSFGVGTARRGSLRGMNQGSAGMILNPYFCELLMMWPEWWTELRPLETDRFLAWQDSHGKLSEAQSK